MFRFKDFVEENKIRQKDLCELFGVSQPYISSLINGRDSVSEDKLNLLRQKYGDIIDKYVSDKDVVYDYESNTMFTMVPLIPLSAQGGSLNDFVSSVRFSECEKIVSPIGDSDIAIQVAGDSMSPEYPNGSRVLAKKINERSFIEWGKTYVLDTCNGVIIKTIVPSESEDKIKCISLNPSPHYAPFEISLKDVYGIYRVQLCMAAK